MPTYKVECTLDITVYVEAPDQEAAMHDWSVTSVLAISDHHARDRIGVHDVDVGYLDVIGVEEA